MSAGLALPSCLCWESKATEQFVLGKQGYRAVGAWHCTCQSAWSTGPPAAWRVCTCLCAAISLNVYKSPMQESKDLQPLVREWLTQIPKGRLAEVTDLQTAIVFMASDACNYMVGHNLVIDGGQSVW